MMSCFSLKQPLSVFVLAFFIRSIESFQHAVVRPPLVRGRLIPNEQFSASHRQPRNNENTPDSNFRFSTSYPLTTSTSLPALNIKLWSRSTETSKASSTVIPPAQQQRGYSSRAKALVTLATQNTFSLVASLPTPSAALSKASESISLQWSDYSQQLMSFVAKNWWSSPTFLALVPLYTFFVFGQDAAMPHWWPVTPMDHILSAPIIAFFLLSNISYFWAGAYLIKRFPFERPTVNGSSLNTRMSAEENSVLAFISNAKSSIQSWRMLPTKKTVLGIMMLAAGLISTVFHTEQALGSYAVANSLCYIDHAIAGTSTFYWFHTCGKPSKMVLALGIVALAALSIPLPSGYAFMHSSWHFLSAAAAVLWALEAFGDRSSQA
jgi:hypothetical protein